MGQNCYDIFVLCLLLKNGIRKAVSPKALITFSVIFYKTLIKLDITHILVMIEVCVMLKLGQNYKEMK